MLWRIGSIALLLAGCATAPRPAAPDPGRLNARGASTLPLDLFGRPETGWAIYAPRIAATLGLPPDAGPGGAAFARALMGWQRTHGLSATGVVDAPTLRAMKGFWQGERPFLRLRAAGVCPDPPDTERLVAVPPEDSSWRRPLQLRPGALAAYQRMVAAARRDDPYLAAHPALLTVFSAYRSPEYDAERCRVEGNCQGVVRAACSAHRTGLAMDLRLDTAPGEPADSTRDVNRLTMTSGPAYRWLVVNAARYGFVNYAFEPWHWEWTGEAP